jgi:hypothetical protein
MRYLRSALGHFFTIRLPVLALQRSPDIAADMGGWMAGVAGNDLLLCGDPLWRVEGFGPGQQPERSWPHGSDTVVAVVVVVALDVADVVSAASPSSPAVTHPPTANPRTTTTGRQRFRKSNPIVPITVGTALWIRKRPRSIDPDSARA